jgi:hypothetical protein
VAWAWCRCAMAAKSPFGKIVFDIYIITIYFFLSKIWNSR